MGPAAPKFENLSVIFQLFYLRLTIIIGFLSPTTTLQSFLLNHRQLNPTAGPSAFAGACQSNQDHGRRRKKPHAVCQFGMMEKILSPGPPHPSSCAFARHFWWLQGLASFNRALRSLPTPGSRWLLTLLGLRKPTILFGERSAR